MILCCFIIPHTAGCSHTQVYNGTPLQKKVYLQHGGGDDCRQNERQNGLTITLRITKINAAYDASVLYNGHPKASIHGWSMSANLPLTKLFAIHRKCRNDVYVYLSAIFLCTKGPFCSLRIDALHTDVMPRDTRGVERILGTSFRL